MLELLRIASVLVVSVVMALSLAHALEYPGKMQLSREDYLTVQRIYYPGFTFGGVLEPVGAVVLASLLYLTPAGTVTFWLTATAFLGIAAMHAIYWFVTHPVNRAWVAGVGMGDLGTSFFKVGSASGRKITWIELRDRWEYSHMLRAVLAFAAFTALVISLRTSS